MVYMVIIFLIIACLFVAAIPTVENEARWIYQNKGRKAAMKYLQGKGKTALEARRLVDLFMEELR